MTPRTVAGLALNAALAGCVLAACGGRAQLVSGPGGIRYQWPPATSVLAASPSQATFCTLLVDDYQHLKTAQQLHGAAAEQRVLQDYVDFAPSLTASAPAAISPAVGRYVGAVAALLRALMAHGLNLLALPRSDLAPMASPQVLAAGTALTSFSTQMCHYDLAANSTPLSRRGGGARA
jgi:hypothetical protein